MLDPHQASRRQFILASARFNATDPNAGYYTATCARVLKHAMMAAGVWDESHRDGFHGIEEAASSLVDLWYGTLIEMVLAEPESARLLNGAGNFVGPAGAFFTGCWLTPAGRLEAERLLDLHPEWIANLRLPKSV
jgi:hypothetical protein